MGFDTRMFEREPVVQPTGYPLARRKRVGPISQIDPEEIAALAESGEPPRSRIFPFIMNMTATSRRTVSTPLLVGPAILRKIFFGLHTVTTPPQQTIEVGYAVNPITETAVALTTPRPYTNLIELIDPFGIANAAAGDGILSDNTANTNVRFEWTLDLIVNLPRFVFTLAQINASATAEQRGGQFVVLEGVSPAALRAFTGS